MSKNLTPWNSFTLKVDSKFLATRNLFSLWQRSGKKFVENSGKIKNLLVKLILEFDRCPTKTSDIWQEIFHIFLSWLFSRFWSRLLIFDNLWLGTNIHLGSVSLRIQSYHSRSRSDLLHRFFSLQQNRTLKIKLKPASKQMKIFWHVEKSQNYKVVLKMTPIFFYDCLLNKQNLSKKNILETFWSIRI